jgi:hypothetical protein
MPFYLHVFNERGLWLPYPPAPDPADLVWGGTHQRDNAQGEIDWFLANDPDEGAADEIAESLAQDGSVPSDDTATVLLDLARAGAEGEFKALARMTNGTATEAEVDTLWHGTRRRLGKTKKGEAA